MPNIKQDFTNSIPITITLDSLASPGTAISSAINNSVDKYLSANIRFKIQTDAAIATGTVTIYILRSVDGGVTYDDPDVGGIITNAEILGVFNANVATTDFTFSVDTNVVGSLPDFWKVALVNNSGDALDSTAANFSVVMLGKTLLIV